VQVAPPLQHGSIAIAQLPAAVQSKLFCTAVLSKDVPHD
jgi:hypothetical protein